MLIVIWQLYILFIPYEFIYNFIVRLSKPYSIVQFACFLTLSIQCKISVLTTLAIMLVCDVIWNWVFGSKKPTTDEWSRDVNVEWDSGCRQEWMHYKESWGSTLDKKWLSCHTKEWIRREITLLLRGDQTKKGETTRKDL